MDAVIGWGQLLRGDHGTWRYASAQSMSTKCMHWHRRKWSDFGRIVGSRNYVLQVGILSIHDLRCLDISGVLDFLALITQPRFRNFKSRSWYRIVQCRLSDLLDGRDNCFIVPILPAQEACHGEVTATRHHLDLLATKTKSCGVLIQTL